MHDPNALAVAQEVWALIERSNAGDEEALPLLRQALSRIDDRALLAEASLSLSEWAEQATRRRVASGQDRRGSRAAIAREMELMRREVCGPDPTPLEAILGQRVVMTHAVCCIMDALLADSADSPLIVRAFRAKNAALADRRLERAVLSLAKLRKLVLSRTTFADQQALRVPSAAGQGAENG